MQIHTSTIALTLLATFSWVVLGYDSYATKRGWPVGAMFAADVSTIKTIGIISLPVSAIAAGYFAVWWSAIVVLVASLFLAQGLTSIFRSFVQPISVIGLTICWSFLIVMLSQA